MQQHTWHVTSGYHLNCVRPRLVIIGCRSAAVSRHHGNGESAHHYYASKSLPVYQAMLLYRTTCIRLSAIQTALCHDQGQYTLSTYRPTSCDGLYSTTSRWDWGQSTADSQRLSIIHSLPPPLAAARRARTVLNGKESKRKSIYIAPFILRILSKCSNMDHTVLPANYTMLAFPL